MRRACAIAALALACIFRAHSAEVSIEIHGLSPELEQAARASLELNHYAERDVSDSQIRRLFSRSEEQIRSALEPFGYYHARISSDLARSGDSAFKAEFTVDAGAPVTVTQTNVRVTGTAADLPEVKTALESFKPKSGEPLDHGIYEASKSRNRYRDAFCRLSRRSACRASRGSRARCQLRRDRFDLGRR